MTCRMGLLALACGALSMCCASGAELEDPKLTGPWVLHDAELERRGMTFDPIPELAAYTAAMAQRLSKATGRDVGLAEDGIPVSYQDDLESQRSDGTWSVDCAQAIWQMTGAVYVQVDIVIDPTPPVGCAPIQVTVLHEAFHALAPEAHHVADGVFSSTVSKSYIDEASLTELCSTFDCHTFLPER